MMNFEDITLSDMQMNNHLQCLRNIKKTFIQSGGWDPTKHAGIIMAHGVIRTDKFIVIPEGIEIQTLTKTGSCPNNKEFLENTNLDTPENRFKVWGQKLAGEGGRIHYPGEIIGDLTLEFKATWGTPGKDLTFANTGVYTNGVINVKVREGKDMTDEQLKNISMNKIHNDNSIVDPDSVWGTSKTLGQILKKISDAGKKGKYFLQACRAGKLVSDLPQYCGKETPQILKESTAETYTNLHQKITEIDNMKNSGPFLSQIKSDDDKLNSVLKKQHFVYAFIEYIRYRIGEENEYTININELCDFMELYYNKNIQSSTINRYINNPFFKKFKKKYYEN